MTTWTDFEAAAPALATRARTILASTINGVLATIRRDGSPRVSGIDPFFFDGDLWIGSMPGAHKSQDLRRDPRLALHCIPWESRHLEDDDSDPGDADAKVSGRAIEVVSPDEVARVIAWFKEDRGVDISVGDLFRIDLESVVLVSVSDDQLVIERWSPEDGLEITRRS